MEVEGLLADPDLVAVHETGPPQLLDDADLGQTLFEIGDGLRVGEVVAVDPIVDVDGRAVRLRARVHNPDRNLLPGLFARIRIVLEQRPDAIVMPESALFQDAGKLFVYRIDGGKAVRTAVSIGQRLPGFVEVRSGLTADAVVATAGHQQLRDGAQGEVVNGPSPGKS